MSTCDLFIKILFLVNLYGSHVTVNKEQMMQKKEMSMVAQKCHHLVIFGKEKSNCDNDLNFAFPQVYMPNFNRLKVNILKIYCTVSTDIYYKGKDQMGLEIGPLSSISNAPSLNRHPIDPNQILPNRL